MEGFKQKIAEARKHHKGIETAQTIIVTGMKYSPKKDPGARKSQLFVLIKNRWFLSGLALIIASLAGTVTGMTDSIAGMEQKIAAPSFELTAPVEASTSLETVQYPIAGQKHKETHDTNAPGQAFNRRIIRSLGTTSTASTIITLPSLFPETGSAASDKTAPATKSTVTTEGGKSAISNPLPATAGIDKEGSWVINLASLSTKADADRLALMARAKDIETEQQQVTVKGKNYWRVQITGFKTEAEARASSSDVKARLGLVDVWISTR